MSEQMTNIKIVGEVEKHPCLYNYRLPEYSRKDVTEEAWKEVGEAVNLTGSECKEKWKNIRNVYVRHMKPVASGSQAKRKRSYYLSDAMQFILPYIKTFAPIPGNLPNISKYEVTTKVEETFEEINEEDNPQIFSQPPSPNTCTLPPPSPESYCLSSPSSSQNELPRAKKNFRKSKDTTDVDQSFLEYFKAKRPKIENYDLVKDSKMMFLLSLLPDLNLMSDVQMRTFRRKVICLIDDIL